MSEVNKPESSADLKCPFNPDQYNLSAPVGSFPWALSQMFLGNKLHRSDWAPNTYVYHSDATKDRPLYISSLGKNCDYPWSPEQQDMIACDWTLLKPETGKPILSFLIASRKSQRALSWGGSSWGYYGNNIYFLFGGLHINQNTINIKRMMEFYWTEPANFISLAFTTDNNKKISQDIYNLMNNKYLYVTVGSNTSYNLGQTGIWGTTSYFSVKIKGAEAQKLGAILKQEFTPFFSLTWRDN
ncbi:Thoeris anti-defense Tad2 family protein [Xenorhabdus anantnagensis]|uniref:DUF2829 domain-containing protein n=1 Tax=Xenorhabdus anantnagensis TaxID=3025875 RepID=A0ABT5LXK2_9GAMM|nr:MW1434 family type I TA system toxin [Xenorhabdus anantnagensis]MDC9598538.1 DUF2829 domain-containing protein [Xenorhabdus anantnagensis]